MYNFNGALIATVGAFQALSEYFLVQVTSNYAYWIFVNDLIFGPVAKYLVPWRAKRVNFARQ